MRLALATLGIVALLISAPADAARKKRKKSDKDGAENAGTSKKQAHPLDGARSPREEGMYRDVENRELPAITEQVMIKEGVFFYGTSMGTPDGKVIPQTLKDGAAPRVKTFLKDFHLDIHTVTNRQFKAFVEETNYKTDAELYKWSFVLEGLTSQKVVDEVDGEKGYGRVKNALHWMAAKGASWMHPYGQDSDVREHMEYPVVHVSYRDAEEYCSWAGGDPAIEIAREKEAGTWEDDKDENGNLDPKKARPFYRLPTEREWERAARAGLINNTYPWGTDPPNNNKPNMPMFNHWPGKDFDIKSEQQIEANIAFDGFHGLAPAKNYLPNDNGLYQMLGNVWEWALGGTHEKRPLRGGSFVDSIDGHFNHAVMVSTRQTNTGDSGSVNSGFRCARGSPINIAIDQRDEQLAAQAKVAQDREIRRKQQDEKKRKAQGKAAGRGTESESKGKSKTSVSMEPEEGDMDARERLARKKASKEAQRKEEKKRKADMKRARRDTTGIKMEL